MAEKLTEKYVKSEIPVCSTEYKKILRAVKGKRLEIEGKVSEIESMKQEFEKLHVAPISNWRRTVEEDEKDVKRKIHPVKEGSIRETIVTPGGTKRKVMASRHKFKLELGQVLHEMVEVSQGMVLKADDLVDRLKNKQKGLEHLERAKILRITSEVFKKKLYYRGKRKEGYYQDLALKEDDDCQNIHETDVDKLNSPVHKQIKTVTSGSSDNLCEPRCKSKLQLVFDEDNGSTIIDQDRVQVLQHEVSRLETLLETNRLLTCTVMQKQEEVIGLYKEITETGNLLGGILSLSERNQIQSEVKKTKEIFNLGLRSNKEVVDILDKLDPLYFSKVLSELKRNCPTIVNILEQLVLSPNSCRNKKKTQNQKLKASVHLLSSLMDVRDQNGSNDVQVLFGLLCLSFGAGPKMIEVLQRIGLSESFPVICHILKKQLENYKTLIAARVPNNHPVITYQDNMQLLRTSLRHLRLTKLQKEKSKQGKMWDFTVRGWRFANIDGIEELFANRKTAVEPQKDVKKVTYEETKLESNKVCQKKYLDFKQRDLLRKMDLAFNAVPLSCQMIKSSSSQDLKATSEIVLSDKQKMFRIDIPEVPEEFPDHCSQKSQMYSLPLSCENQCTTLGMGANLNKFTEEFNFFCPKESSFLPLKKSCKEFNLDLAYKRFAFLKSMEMHKKDQKEYESYLRKSVIDDVSDDDLLSIDEQSDGDDNDNLDDDRDDEDTFD